ncbi:hypothetical protein [Allosaccharopolyspora coralli]|uniref:hypothetical protein n=1 Tax=Allosaccharopolyspora coralli TaxID=2665642 RepID=UPI001C9E73B4|nr:hypothetical protein [Allosaccharopolyspora coralli]
MARLLSTTLSGWRRFYGANPLHLLVVLAGAALAGYAVSFVSTESMATRMLIWFVGALVVHDLLLFPLYALADRSLLVGRWARRRLTRRHEPRVPAINHLRVPALGSGLLLLVFLPVITGQGESAYVTATGMTTEPYLQRWVWISVVLFAVSAVLYVVRLAVAVAVGVRDSRRAARAAAARGREAKSKAGVGATGSTKAVAARDDERGVQGRKPSASAEQAAADSGTARRVDPAPEQATVDHGNENLPPHKEDDRR